ncbi:MAG: YfhO family protein, partial [Solirubrobacteraceae bacterium]
LQLGAYDRHDSAAVAAQSHADHSDGAELDRLIAVIERAGGGRAYAGMPSNWGQNFTVGAVPVFKYLESRDVDEVGYTLRTASLMTDPEYYFDERNPGDYTLFGIHYLIISTGSRPPIPAALKLRAGAYSLWMLPGTAGVVHAGTIVGHLTANRTNIGTRTLPVLRSDLAQHQRYEQVRFDQSGSGALARSSTGAPPRRSAGTVVAQADHLTAGRAAATVAMHRRAVVVLSASFDPGWTATVDGRSQPAEMVAPALVATTVQAGTHRVVFRYRGFRGYPLLLAITAATLLALLCAEVARLSGQ